MTNKEIQPAVAIDIHEGRRDAPSWIGGAADSRRIAERAVAVVAQQLIRSELGDVEIDAAVVVVVAGGGAHAVAAHVDAALFGDVGES